MLSQVVELIENKNRFGITTHVRPDGDGVGSSLGLCWLLKSLGKEAEVIVRDGIPASYLQLPGADEIRRVSEIDREYDAVFVIECSNVDRPGIEKLEEQFVVNIDHHATCEQFGTINWIDATASAVGEMIYNLCKAIGGRVSKEIAECVYMALVTDTGSFHFPNTTERTLKVASELVKVGVQPSRISEAVYNSYSWSRVALLQKVLATARRDESGRIALMRQTLAMKEETGAVDGDNNGFVNMPLVAKEVLGSVYMREVKPGTYRVSVRSKGPINVARVAESFGGGGHKNAAGFRITGDWDELEREIEERMNEAVDLAFESDPSLDVRNEYSLA
ncbi:MAG: bifunctional oligoribonuclease/PAP phosphatase NrnA [Acidobacteria bacterium]|nr:MAG: bifunctional oligoribonuclease/PAP phosphatase NrnA [Acidobacteriota bacterium]REK01853.1 MAG: bifunctional oligoribonuclease/PAP phosphatase NrnA [Acidobacteriota bacterium]REK14809.1 MAG: bifunctional oligoribonuclease/PAP phosphatase NrnA [Acidobacteriota bacterium]REK45524.1 MAG: bifunctional oligoribonuclease/PAP phosphatase NrnA [Acidobacteriota bacterium]